MISRNISDLRIFFCISFPFKNEGRKCECECDILLIGNLIDISLTKKIKWVFKVLVNFYNKKNK